MSSTIEVQTFVRLTKIDIPVLARGQTPATCTVKLMLAALEGDKPDQRVFDVKIGDKIVLKSFDPATHKGAIVEQFENIPAIENLMVELIPATPPSEPIHKVLKILHTNAQEITGGVADK